MAAVWKGSISFGLVNIGVSMVPAVRDHRPRFRLLHKTDRSTVRLERICQAEGEPVAWEDLVKGYEYEPGKFVVLKREDFRSAALEKSNSVEILDFVEEVEIDDRYFETPYHLVPQKGAERAYALLREALRNSGKVGITKIVMRETQHLAALYTVNNALVLTMMRFADELADPDELNVPDNKGLREAELKMAGALIDNLTAKWSPAKYTDDYVDNLMKIIKAKSKGRAVKLTEAAKETQSAQVINLMERLRESLKADKAAKTAPARRRSKQAKKKTRVA